MADKLVTHLSLKQGLRGENVPMYEYISKVFNEDHPACRKATKLCAVAPV